METMDSDHLLWLLANEAISGNGFGRATTVNRSKSSHDAYALRSAGPKQSSIRDAFLKRTSLPPPPPPPQAQDRLAWSDPRSFSLLFFFLAFLRDIASPRSRFFCVFFGFLLGFFFPSTFCSSSVLIPAKMEHLFRGCRRRKRSDERKKTAGWCFFWTPFQYFSTIKRNGDIRISRAFCSGFLSFPNKFLFSTKREIKMWGRDSDPDQIDICRDFIRVNCRPIICLRWIANSARDISHFVLFLVYFSSALQGKYTQPGLLSVGLSKRYSSPMSLINLLV